MTCTSLYQLDFSPTRSTIACETASILLSRTTIAVDLPDTVGTGGHSLCLSHHNTLCHIKMDTKFWEVSSQIERATVLEGRATGENGSRGVSFGYQSLIPAEISAEI